MDLTQWVVGKYGECLCAKFLTVTGTLLFIPLLKKDPFLFIKVALKTSKEAEAKAKALKIKRP